MSNFRYALVVVFSLGAGAILCAQNLTVAYLQGEVQLKTGSGWSELSIGDEVPRDGTLQVSDGGYLELTDHTLTITLSQAGSYSVQALLLASQRMSKVGAGRTLSAMLFTLVNGPSRVQSTAMGARGANESKTDQPDWVTSDAEVYLKSGREFIKLGEYAKAIEELRRALEVATDEESLEVRYYLASAYSLSGDTRSALTQISRVTLASGEPWAPDYVLLKAKLLVDTFAFKEEITWLTEQRGGLSQDAQRASAFYFLLALGYQGVGDTANEKESLAQVTHMAAGSDLGKVAAKMLNDL
jgi:tetratricopeptide (TPR) repeat protein